jgi:CRP/FNR family transcriptional regulator, cyclic AMP receptor protein
MLRSSQIDTRGEIVRGGIPQSRLELLRALPLFSGCSDKHLNQIDGLVDDVEMPAGEVLAQEGEIGYQAFIVVRGLATVTLRGQHLATLGPGSLFGEMSLVELAPRSATVEAATPMHLLVLGRRQFFAVLAVEGVAVKLLRTVAGRLRELDGAYVGEAS